MADTQDDKQAMFLSAARFKTACAPHGTVVFSFEVDGTPLGLPRMFDLGAELTPAEARRLAESLLRTADVAEATPPQTQPGTPIVPGPSKPQ